MSQDRFKARLRDQIDWISRSCAAFDKGSINEATRVAIHLRTLFHQTGRTTSLLTQLNANDRHILTTAEEIPAHAIQYNGGLSWIKRDGATGALTYVPVLDRGFSRGFIPASHWWKQEIYVLSSGERVTRRMLVLAAVDQDGGAHVDAELAEYYQAIKEGKLLVPLFLPGVGHVDRLLNDSHLTDFRQMGHEVLNSPQLMALAGSGSV